MNRVACYCLAMATAIGALTAQAAEPRISREAIEWCNIWIPDTNETKRPRVLLIGDSITGGYGPKVADALKGKVSVARPDDLEVDRRPSVTGRGDVGARSVPL